MTTCFANAEYISYSSCISLFVVLLSDTTTLQAVQTRTEHLYDLPPLLSVFSHSRSEICEWVGTRIDPHVVSLCVCLCVCAPSAAAARVQRQCDAMFGKTRFFIVSFFSVSRDSSMKPIRRPALRVAILARLKVPHLVAFLRDFKLAYRERVRAWLPRQKR